MIHTQARAALAAGDHVAALRLCAAAMAEELAPAEVEAMVEVLDEIRGAKPTAARSVVAFEVPGPPVPKARARVINGHAHTPAKTKAYERHVAMCALAAVVRSRTWRKDWGAYALHVVVCRAEARGDADNYCKAVSDALNGVAYLDDAAVREVHVVVDEDRARPRVEVRVEMLGEETADERSRRTRREQSESRRARIKQLARR